MLEARLQAEFFSNIFWGSTSSFFFTLLHVLNIHFFSILILFGYLEEKLNYLRKVLNGSFVMLTITHLMLTIYFGFTLKAEFTKFFVIHEIFIKGGLIFFRILEIGGLWNVKFWLWVGWCWSIWLIDGDWVAPG